MKKKVRNLFAGAAAMLLAGFAHNVQATHFQGSEMTYTCVAPGMYQVNLKLYRDCTGVTAPTTATLNLKSTGCNPGRNVTMARFGSPQLGNPYCPQITPSCLGGSSTYANYEEVVFSASVTFSQAEQQCADWTLSWTECCRPSTANLQSQGSLYTEANLKLFTTATVAGTATHVVHNNSSPVFGTLVVPYVNAYMPITLSTYAIDADEDSLVYSFTTPLENPTTAVPYTNYNALTITDPDTNSIKVASAPAGTYSAAFPMHAFNVDWTQAIPVATPYFDLNTSNGSLTFTPTAYFPNTPSAQGLNKYVTVVKVDEYRKMPNGVMVKIGTVRRDMFITVMDCGPNTNPRVANPLANNQPIAPNDIITLRPGTPLTFNVSSADGNTNDVLAMESDAAAIMPGAVFAISPGNRPTGTLTWTPTASHVRNQVYYFRVTVKDNACPVKGVQVQTYGVRVSNTGGVTGVNEKLTSLPRFVAYPNPFSDHVSFKVNVGAEANQHLLIYNALGQQVDKIDLKGFASGEQTVTWKKASKMANGQYIARLISNQKEAQTIQFSKMQ